VAYEGLLRSEREALHARTAEAIETQFRGRLEEVTETLAFHWSHSGNLEKAIPSLIAAGAKAMERFALEESHAHYQRAYDLLDASPPSTTRDRGIVNLLLESSFLAYYQARLHQLGELLRAHQEAVDRVGNEADRGMWLAWRGHAYCVAEGDQELATSTLDEAVRIGRAAGSHRVVAYAQAWRIYSLWYLGRVDEAIAAGEEAVSLSRHLPEEPYIWFKATCGLGLVRTMLGDFSTAGTLADELVTFGEESGNARARAMGYIVRLNLAGYSADMERSAAALESALAASPDPIYDHVAAGSRAIALALTGDAATARQYVDDQTRRYVKDLHVHYMSGWLDLAAALIKMKEGQLSEGFAELHAMARGIGLTPLLSNWAKMLLALAYAEVAIVGKPQDAIQNPLFAIRHGWKAPREARARLEDNLSQLEARGMGGCRFIVEMAFARLLQAQGDRESAIEHIRSGIRFIDSLGETAGLLDARNMLVELGG
jgi:tetratricopeptide (TPR) repeat protein